MNIINVFKIAKKEIKFNFYNYWFLLSSFIFCITNFTIIYFGEVLSGDYSQTDIRSLALSIIHLQMYLVPLLSFILSYDAILSEKELGTLDLILSYRISFLDILIGKLFGNSIIFAISFVFGFFPILIYLYLLGINFLNLICFIFISIWLNVVCNSLAIYASNLSKDRTFVILLSMLIWLFFVFIYDMLLIFITTMFYGVVTNNFLNFMLFLNPIEIFRLISILIFVPFDANDLLGINIGLIKIKYIMASILFWLLFLLLIFFYTKKKE